MLRWNDYNVRVWEDGDVSISLPNEFQYGTMLNSYGLQCNADGGTDEYERILVAARSVGDALARLDEAIAFNRKK